jgi:hypothetical protein
MGRRAGITHGTVIEFLEAKPLRLNILDCFPGSKLSNKQQQRACESRIALQCDRLWGETALPNIL